MRKDKTQNQCIGSINACEKAKPNLEKWKIIQARDMQEIKNKKLNLSFTEVI